MTICGLNSELEGLRYHESWDNTPIDAPLTSGSHNFWSNCWIFIFHTFLETGSQDLFKSVKINLIWGHLKIAALQGLPPRKTCWGYKRPQAPPYQKKKKKVFPGSYSLPGRILSFSPFFQKTHKNTSKPLDSSFFTKITRYCSYTRSSSPWFYALDLGFRGMDVAF